MSKIAKNLVYLLLQRDPTKRLGYGSAARNGDVVAIKKHPFFKRINFEKLLNRQITPPHIIKYGIDNRNNLENLTSNFDDKFISEPMPKSLYFKDYNFQSDVPADNVPESKYANVFDGFSFVHQGVLASYHKYDDIRQEMAENAGNNNDIAQQLAGQSYRQKDDFFVSQCAKSLGMSRRGSNPGAKGANSGTNLMNVHENQLQKMPSVPSQRSPNNLASGDRNQSNSTLQVNNFQQQQLPLQLDSQGLQLNNNNNQKINQSVSNQSMPFEFNQLNLHNSKTEIPIANAPNMGPPSTDNHNNNNFPINFNMNHNPNPNLINNTNLSEVGPPKIDPFNVMSPSNNHFQQINITTNPNIVPNPIVSPNKTVNNNNLGISPSLNLNSGQIGINRGSFSLNNEKTSSNKATNLNQLNLK